MQESGASGSSRTMQEERVKLEKAMRALVVSYNPARRIECPTCGASVRADGFREHLKTRKCKCKNQYTSRAEIGKARVVCGRCSVEVCKNKLKRHQRSNRCKLAGFAFVDEPIASTPRT